MTQMGQSDPNQFNAARAEELRSEQMQDMMQKYGQAAQQATNLMRQYTDTLNSIVNNMR